MTWGFKVHLTEQKVHIREHSKTTYSDGRTNHRFRKIFVKDLWGSKRRVGNKNVYLKVRLSSI